MKAGLLTTISVRTVARWSDFLVRRIQPYDSSRRMWYVGDPHHERPLVQILEPAVGFYALNGQSMVSFPKDQTKERICECLERIREQNPGSGFCSSWTITSRTRVNTRAYMLTNLASILCLSQLVRLISIQLSRFGRVSSGSFPTNRRERERVPSSRLRSFLSSSLLNSASPNRGSMSCSALACSSSLRYYASASTLISSPSYVTLQLLRSRPIQSLS
jgi:hypothetical protein